MTPRPGRSRSPGRKREHAREDVREDASAVDALGRGSPGDEAVGAEQRRAVGAGSVDLAETARRIFELTAGPDAIGVELDAEPERPRTGRAPLATALAGEQDEARPGEIDAARPARLP